MLHSDTVPTLAIHLKDNARCEDERRIFLTFHIAMTYVQLTSLIPHSRTSPRSHLGQTPGDAADSQNGGSVVISELLNEVLFLKSPASPLSPSASHWVPNNLAVSPASFHVQTSIYTAEKSQRKVVSIAVHKLR
jgi:hypothetical protein